MAVLIGSIVGTAHNGSLTTKSVAAAPHSIGYDLGAVPISVEGREMSYSEVGTLSTTADIVDIYRWGTWRVLDTHGDNLIGFVTDKYLYGERTKIGVPFEREFVIRHKFVGVANGVGLIRETLKGTKVKENYPGLDWVIKVRVPVHQTGLTGKTWGDWSYNGSGGGTSTHLRPRRYPDTHIPRRREDA